MACIFPHGGLHNTACCSLIYELTLKNTYIQDERINLTTPQREPERNVRILLLINTIKKKLHLRG